MAFHKVTYNRHLKQANLYWRGCNFRCHGCSYKIKGQSMEMPLPVESVKKTLENLDITRVHFLGGEPTLNPDLSEISVFAHDHLGVYTKIGHCNGSGLPDGGIDAMSVSIKTYSDDIHIAYTGVSNAGILRNFKAAYGMEIELDASSVLIPGCVDHREIEKIAAFISDIDPFIPYHIVSFIPPAGSPWRGPSLEEMEQAASVARQYFLTVTFSLVDMEDFLHRKRADMKYASQRVS